jgi:hypothetical protein
MSGGRMPSPSKPGRMPSPSKPFVSMTDPPRSDRPVDHYEAALEASCDTLIALQVIRASATSPAVEVGRVETQLMRAISRQVTRAIRSQRRAIAEVRLARNEPETTPILGFVLEADVADCGVSSLRAQSRPRRTA